MVYVNAIDGCDVGLHLFKLTIENQVQGTFTAWITVEVVDDGSVEAAGGLECTYPLGIGPVVLSESEPEPNTAPIFLEKIEPFEDLVQFEKAKSYQLPWMFDEEEDEVWLTSKVV